MNLARKAVRLLGVAVVAVVILAGLGAYGSNISVFLRDLWGADFTYLDNDLPVTVKLHRVPDLDAPGQAGPEASWPEQVLRPACWYTLNRLGLSGPEGGLWTAVMEGDELVVYATDGTGEVGRYRVTEGSAPTGLAVVECDAGPNGLHLMNLLQPAPEKGWFVVTAEKVLDGGVLGDETSYP